MSVQHLVGAPAVMHKVLDLGGVSLLAERGAFFGAHQRDPRDSSYSLPFCTLYWQLGETMMCASQLFIISHFKFNESRDQFKSRIPRNCNGFGDIFDLRVDLFTLEIRLLVCSGSLKSVPFTLRQWDSIWALKCWGL